MDSLIASEMQQIELESSDEVGDYSEIAVSRKELLGGERSVIDIVYGNEDFEADENDEKALL